jgi:flagellar protein FlaJ
MVDKTKPEDEGIITSKGGGKIRVKDERIEWIRSEEGFTYNYKEVSPKELEKETIKRIQKKQKKEIEDSKKNKKSESEYLKIASKIFSKTSRRFMGNKSFQKMQDQLMKANLKFTPVGYLSTIFLTTTISALIAGFLFLFFLFFNFGATLPIITRATETVNIRFFKVFWILFVVPIVTFLTMYIYPSLEKKSAGEMIDIELPFATIHMASIAGSMINPIKIFEIINTTKEYPALEKEFTKMINEINIYGYDLVSALKNTAKNSPSKKLSELLNGLATTLNSGGDLPKFFEERSQTLLFNYRIQQQKDAKAAETAMDMYISLLIAAPMILMLLMMIMKLSGLGIAMSVSMIGLLVTLGVVILNIFFLVFLQLKRQH